MTLKIPQADVLRASGLPEREALIWYTLSREGAQNISDLSALSGLNRPALYKLLPNLMKRGLVEKTRVGKRTHFVTTGKKVLKEWQNNQERRLDGKLAVLPETPRENMLPGDVLVYRGKHIRKVWEDVLCLPRGSVFYRYDGYPVGTPVEEYIPEGYGATIQKRNLERFVVTNDALRHSAFERRIECESRMLPKAFGEFDQGVSQFIYGDKIALVDFTTETAYVIVNKALAEYHRTLFRFLLKTLKE